jgi:hypothetical protein
MEAHRTKTHAGREGNGTLEGLRDVASHALSELSNRKTA